MKRHLLLALTLTALSLGVHAGCPELKSAIDAKIRAKGARNFSLDVVAAADVGAGKVVGECDDGKNKLVYSRGSAGARAAAPAATPAAAAPKPPKANKPVPALGNY